MSNCKFIFCFCVRTGLHLGVRQSLGAGNETVSTVYLSTSCTVAGWVGEHTYSSGVSFQSMNFLPLNIKITRPLDADIQIFEKIMYNCIKIAEQDLQ